MYMYIDSAKIPGTKVSPTQQTSRIGEKATFVCRSDSNVTWTYNGDKLPPNAKGSKTPEGDHKITITNVKPSNTGTYECLSWSSILKKHYILGDGNLKVQGILKYSVYSCFLVFV